MDRDRAAGAVDRDRGCRSRAYRFLGYPLLLVSVALLLLVLVPGIGVNVSGATRWIDLPGGLQIQPSEPAKLALVLWGADLLARKEKRLGADPATCCCRWCRSRWRWRCS